MESLIDLYDEAENFAKSTDNEFIEEIRNSILNFIKSLESLQTQVDEQEQEYERLQQSLETIDDQINDQEREKKRCEQSDLLKAYRDTANKYASKLKSILKLTKELSSTENAVPLKQALDKIAEEITETLSTTNELSEDHQNGIDNFPNKSSHQLSEPIPSTSKVYHFQQTKKNRTDLNKEVILPKRKKPHKSKKKPDDSSNKIIDQPASFECDICKRTFLKKQGVATHIQRTHVKNDISNRRISKNKSKQRLIETAKSNQRLFECDFCKKTFPKKQGVAMHIRKIHLKNQNSSSTTATASDTRCDICNKQYSSIYNLKTHRRNIHAL